MARYSTIQLGRFKKSTCQFFSASSVDSMHPNQNTSKLFYGYSQSDSEVYVERQRAQNNQYDIEGEQSHRTDTTQIQDTL